jgi:phosphoenolpyruvate-protein kinase (PTS system EI component)
MGNTSASIEQTIRDAVGAAGNDQRSDSVVTALNSIHPDELNVFFHAGLESASVSAQPATTGLPASPGAAAGEVVLDAARAVALADEGRSVILVRSETNPNDTLGMQAAKGILTTRGGLGSHAAIVARGWGKPAVVGASEVSVVAGGIEIDGTPVKEGDYLTIDGSTGAVYIGELEVSSCEPPPELKQLLHWADQVAATGKVEVRANADTEADAAMGRTLGAKGIGLCRTEHMFLSSDRLPLMRRFILSETAAEEQESLQQLEQAQVSDFESVLEAMDGLPVTVRLLDPPLHEFLPDILDLTAKEARGELSNFEATELKAARRLHETNPMIGTRGVRLGMVRSGLYEMQVRALSTAAANLIKRGKKPRIEIMIPLIVNERELSVARQWVTEALDQSGHPELAAKAILIGAMIETPRAAIVAGALSQYADFFSFGTNDLTQMTFAFSRDDVEASMLPAYLKQGVLEENPFAALDVEGVGALVEMGCKGARQAKPAIKLGVCGEHAGHPDSVDFFVRAGVDSVSCSPFRVPLSRLAVAQALLASGRVSVEDVSFTFDEAKTSSADTDCGPGSSDGPGEQSPDETALEVDEDLVLHVLRVRGFITPDGLMESLGTVPDKIMADFVSRGWVNHMEARNMYTLTPEGTEEQQRRFDESADPSLAEALSPGYEQFLELNNEFKELCGSWQMKDGAPNDHSDAAYDKVQIDALMSLADRVQPVITQLAEALPRLARYNDRLQAAAKRVAAGETKMFTGVMCGSFHDIWMELHEDLIVLQSIDRGEEGSF